MIGANATVGANQNLNVAAGGTFGSINLTTKTANQSVAIGGGSGEDAERRTYAYGDQSLAIGSDTLAYGDGSVAIGGDDLDSAGNQQTSYTDPNSGAQTTGTVRQAYNALTGDTMQSGVYAKTVSKQAAVAVGVQAQAADLGVALGAKSGATKTNSVAIGTGAQATLDNAVAIGGGSKTLEAGTKQESTTINGVTYNWAGGGKTLPGDIVSFGSSGYERQLKHVAAGEVSATSTDAINGSQLYAVAAATSYLANGDSPVVRTNAAGEPLKKARDGNYYKAGDVNADGSPKAGAVAQTPVALSLTHHDGTATPTTLHNVAAGSADTDAVNVSQIYNYAHVNDGTATQGAGIATSNRAKVNEKGGATGDYAIAVGVETVAAGNSSTAAGYRASATNAGDIALGHNAIAAGRSTATGTITAGNVTGETYGPAMAQGAFANATGRNAIAIGNNAQAKGNAAGTVNDVIAIGGNSTASGDRTIALGYKATAGKAGTVAIGETAGNTNSETAVFIGKSAGSGNTSSSGNTHGIAIGNGAGTGMTGGTENVAIGANSGTVVNGNTNYAIGSRAGQTVTGSDDYAMGIEAGQRVSGSQNSTFGYHSGTDVTGSSNSAFGRDAGKNVVGSQNLAFGAHAGQYVGVTGTAAQDNIAIGTNANKFAAGSELTTSGNTAIGKNSTAKGGSSVALGDTATADKANAVALGANSNTDVAAARVTQATVGSITYSGFAGGTNIQAGDQVSVGKTGSERQIKHVAPGEISATSTDAINGSQLYAVAEKAQTHYYSVKSTETGTDSNYANDGATGSNSLAAGAKAKASAMNTVAVGYNAQATNDSAVAVGANTEATNASTALGDSSKAKGKNSTALGWNANAVGEADVFIGKQAGGNTMNVGNSRNIGIGEGAISNVGNTKVSNIIGIGTGAAAGMQGDHNIALGAYANGTGNDFAAVTTSNNVAIGERTRASGGNSIAIGNRNKAEGQAAIALGVGSNAAGQNSFAAGQNAQATAAGTIAIGGSPQAANAANASGSQAIAIGRQAAASNTDSLALGRGAKSTHNSAVALGADSVTAAAVGTNTATVGDLIYSGFAGAAPVATVSVGDADKERTITNVAAGRINNTSTDAINGSQLYWTQDAISNVGKSSKNILGGNAAMDNRGNITMSNIGDIGENTVHDAIKAVKATANKGWNVQTNGSGTTNVAPGDTVNFKNGTNIAITHAGKEITIATNPNLTADSLTINNGGPVINNSGINMGNKSINNMADGNIANGSKEAVNGGQLFQTNQKVDTNTANIAKGINFGGTSGANKYHLGDTINVKGDNNITSTTVNGGVQLGLKDTITVGPANGGNPVTINGNAGTVGGLSNKTWNPNNIVSGQAATEDQLKAVTDEAAKKGSFTLTAQGANGSTVGDGATVDLNNTDGNISVSKNAANNNVTFNLNKNIKVESVTHVDAAGNTTITNGKGMTTTDTAGNTTVVNSTGVKTTDAAGNTTITNATGMTTSDAAGNTTAITGNGMTISKPGKDVVSLTGDGLNNGNNKITNVKAGEADTDAVNVSQLKKAADAAKTKVVEGDGIKVAETKNTDGSSTYKVSADTAPITTVNNKAATAGNNKQLATAQDVVNAVNNSGFTLKSSANGGEKESGADEVIKPGSTVDMAAGKNIKVKQEANGKITYSTKDEVEFDKVTVGGVVIDKNNGINAGNKKIANVANGTGDKDAVNVSQLKGAADAFGGNAGINTDGTFRAPSYNLVDGKPADNKPPRTYNNVGDALGALNTAVTSPLTFGGDSGSNFDRKLGSQVYVKGGATGVLSDNNIGVVSDGNKTVTDGNGVTITPAGGGNPVSLTNTGLNNGGNKITNVADGVADSDAANVKQVKAARTEVKAGTNIASVDKTQANDGHDIYTVNAKGTTVSGAGDVIVTATNSGDNVTNYQVSLSGGVKQDIGKGVQAYDIVTTQGIRFGGDTGVTNVHKLGDTMMIMGDQNVKTAADVDGIHMRLNPDVNVNSVTTGDTKMNDEGVAIKNGPALTKQGISAGNLPIRNVAPGRIAPDSRDAVNGAQLHALGRYVDNVDKRAKAGTASAIATAGLPQAYRPGASMVAAAGGYYDGQSAVAIGVSTISDNGRWVIKGAANVNSKEAGATIGIGYQW